MNIEVASISLRRLRFPDRAGELQERGATAALVRELGDNYAKYHAFLAHELAAFDKRPGQAEMLRDMDAYFEAWGKIDDIVRAEAVIRRCRALRTQGRALSERPDDQHPVVDERDRLVSAETGAPEPGITGRRVESPHADRVAPTVVS